MTFSSSIERSGNLGARLPGRIRVVVGEDGLLVRTALNGILSKLENIEPVAFVGDRDSLLEAIARERPDAVLTGIRMPPTGTDEGLQVARELRATDPEIGVVILSQFLEPSYPLALFDCGTARRAYLLKEHLSDRGQLAAALETVVAGGAVIDPTVVDVLVRARSAAAHSPLATLSPRELDVLAQLAQGKSNAVIARSLVLTRGAVEKHISAIFAKLELGSPEDVSRRVKAALLFLAQRRRGTP